MGSGVNAAWNYSDAVPGPLSYVGNLFMNEGALSERYPQSGVDYLGNVPVRRVLF